MPDFVIDIIELLVIDSDKIGIDEISVENSYCSIVSRTSGDFETELEEEQGLNPKAIFIYDELNKDYYCVFIAGR